MVIKRTFGDILFGRTTKEVLKKDENGDLVGKTIYTFDKKTGNIIGIFDCVFDPVSNSFIKQKNRRFCPDGKEPLETTYYDEQGRVQTQNNYHQDELGKSWGVRRRYGYSSTGIKLELSETGLCYEGEIWVAKYSRKKEYDSFGKLIQQSNFEYSPSQKGLVCIKEETFTRNEDGTYDPKKTIYRDFENRIIKESVYWREKTNISEIPLLFAETTYISYKNGKKTISDQGTDVFFLGGWMPKEIAFPSKQKGKAAPRKEGAKKKGQKKNAKSLPKAQKEQE